MTLQIEESELEIKKSPDIRNIILKIQNDPNERIERSPEEISALIDVILGEIKEALSEKGWTMEQLLNDKNTAIENVPVKGLPSNEVALVHSKIQKGENGTELGLEAKIVSKQVFELIQAKNKLEKENAKLTTKIEISEAEKIIMEEKNKMSKTILNLIRHDTKGRGAENFFAQLIDGSTESSIELLTVIKNLLGQQNDTRLHWLALLSALNSNKQTPKEYNLTGDEFQADTFKRMKLLTEKKDLSFEINIQDEIKDIQQNTDRDYVCGILGNILENAVKFTPKNKKISISLKKNSENSNVVDLVVENDGEGFPTETIQIKNETDTYLNHLNNGNEVPSKTGTNGERGTGRGLSLCLHVAKLFKNNGGNLQYKNRTDKEGNITGSIVTFSIPKETSSAMNEVDIPSLETN